MGADNYEVDWSAVADATHAEWVRSEMQDEMEALRKDAERYRWLRDRAPETWDISRWLDSDNQEVHLQDYLDEAIDAEMDACMKGEGDE